MSEKDVALKALAIGFVLVIASLSVGIAAYTVNPALLWPTETRPAYEAVYDRTVVIKPGSYFHILMDIPRRPGAARVEGFFDVIGGLGDGVEAFILEKQAFLDWKEGLSLAPRYASGRVGSGNIWALLGSGTYYLVFSNTFCRSGEKRVRMRLKVTGLWGQEPQSLPDRASDPRILSSDLD